MIRAAFFDVDGTLLSHKTKQVPRSTVEAMEKLKQQGIRCIVAPAVRSDRWTSCPWAA